MTHAAGDATAAAPAAPARRERRWVPASESRVELDSTQVLELARALSLPRIVAALLIARGYDEAARAEEFLAPSLRSLHDPGQLRGIDAAVEAFEEAVEQQRRVVVYGDYDVDGVSSTSLLVGFLGELGLKVETYIPNREREGYGLNRDAIAKIAAGGPGLLVTVDHGVSAADEVDFAVDQGMEVVIIDHHQTPPELPRARAILNPHQPGCAFPFKDMAAVGVTFNVAAALRRRLRDKGRFDTAFGRKEPDLRRYLDLVAMGTVADVMPLVDENRIFVTHGIAQIERGRRPGLRALREVAQVGPGQVDGYAIGFRLAPRINAVGRLNDADLGVRLLCSDDAEETRELAETLDTENRRRQKIEAQILAEAIEQVEADASGASAGAIVVAKEGWHVGVVGIVASRLVDRFHRPAVVIGLEEGGASGRGSCRSIPGFDLYAGLKQCAEHLEAFGGHPAAAGLTIRGDAVDGFRRRLIEVAEETLSAEDLVPRLKIDLEVDIDEVDFDLADGLARLEPFGMGNRAPVFAARGVPLRESRTVGQGGAHLKLRVGPGLDAIAFGMGDRHGHLGRRVDLAFTPRAETWRGRRRLSLHVKDIKTP